MAVSCLDDLPGAGALTSDFVGPNHLLLPRKDGGGGQARSLPLEQIEGIPTGDAVLVCLIQAHVAHGVHQAAAHSRPDPV